MRMKTPVHPGRIVREDCLEPLGLTVTAAAEALGVSRVALSNVVNEKGGISPEMALRLEIVFGGVAETWLRMQVSHDLAKAKKAVSKLRLHRYTAPALRAS